MKIDNNAPENEIFPDAKFNPLIKEIPIQSFNTIYLILFSFQ